MKLTPSLWVEILQGWKTGLLITLVISGVLVLFFIVPPIVRLWMVGIAFGLCFLAIFNFPLIDVLITKLDELSKKRPKQ